MEVQEKEERLKPWLDFINNNDLDVKVNEDNKYETADLSEYKKLYESWLSTGHSDVFMIAFGVPAQGVGIGCDGGTKLNVTFTGDICELKNML